MEAAGKDGLASLHIPAAFCCIAQIFDLHLEHFQAETEREREREIEVGEKSQKSTAGITMRTFKYEYM